jgi:hypothetical protein
MKWDRNLKPKDGTIRRMVFDIVTETPHLSPDQIAVRLGVAKSAISAVLQILGFSVTQEDLQPTGDPFAHDRLLSALRAAHPGGFEDEIEAPARRWQPGPTQSLMGCAAAMAIDAA